MTTSKPLRAVAAVQLAVDFEADVILVGTHERKALELIVLGSVSSEVLRRAPCSVLVSRVAATRATRPAAQERQR